jgi:hypothetical protein
MTKTWPWGEGGLRQGRGLAKVQTFSGGAISAFLRVSYPFIVRIMRRTCPAFSVLLVVGTIWVSPTFCLAQTTPQQRYPVVSGCVVDHDPTSYTADGDAVESNMLIGHINGVERRAIMEFNIADLLPGQVETARFTGSVGPSASTPPDLRQHQIRLGVGDGVLSVADNSILTGTSNGWFEHNAGDTTTFNYGCTRIFREVVRQNAQFLRAQIYSGNSSQGWDEVKSVPSPALQLTVRPVTTSSVVYYQPPIAVGAASAQGSGPFSIDTSSSSAGVMDWNYSPYQKGRGLLEFNVASIPQGAQIQWAKLEVYVSGLQTQFSIGPNLQIVGYAGDGVVSVDDVSRSATLIGTSGQLNDSNGVGTLSWDLDPASLGSLISSDNYLGIQIRPGVNPERQARIELNNGATSGRTPYLAMAYTIPEPSSLALLLTATIGGLVWRHRRSSTA